MRTALHWVDAALDKASRMNCRAPMPRRGRGRLSAFVPQAQKRAAPIPMAADTVPRRFQALPKYLYLADGGIADNMRCAG